MKKLLEIMAKSKKVLSIFLCLFLLLSFPVQAKDPPKKYLDENYVFKDLKFIKWPEKTGVWGK